MSKETLSIAKCREILGETAEGMSDERVTEIRDYLYSLCSNVIRNELEKVK